MLYIHGIMLTLQIILDDHFALAYKSSASPVSCILEDPNVTLMGLTKTHAFFAVTDEDMYDLYKYPFVYMAQARHTRELITMSLKNFIKLGSMVQSNSNTLLLNNSARYNFS